MIAFLEISGGSHLIFVLSPDFYRIQFWLEWSVDHLSKFYVRSTDVVNIFIGNESLPITPLAKPKQLKKD